MRKRKLGKTGIEVSEIGFGGEWLARHEFEESVELLRYAHDKDINIVDCWMPDPKSRDIIGKAMEGCRDSWYVQGHIGSTYQNGQYVRTRDMKHVEPAFLDLLKRMKTDYIDLGMIHYIDSLKEWNTVMNSDYIEYVHKLHRDGIIRHIGLSTHNPVIGKLAVETGFIEMILFSINPAFDMRPATEDLYSMFGGYDKDQLAWVIRTYGEEKWASRIADFIVSERAQGPIKTTGELTELIKAAIPASARRDGPHPAKRTFQAIRIEVNGELDQLREAVDEYCDMLLPGGRLCIITFHSLEDRIVKETFARRLNPCTCPKDLPVCICGKVTDVRKVTGKPITAGDKELEENPRSRSAKLRIIEKRQSR